MSRKALKRAQGNLEQKVVPEILEDICKLEQVKVKGYILLDESERKLVEQIIKASSATIKTMEGSDFYDGTNYLSEYIKPS